MTAALAEPWDERGQDAPPEDRAVEAELRVIEAEHMLLGALLCENEAFYLLSDLRPDHFLDPVNGAVFEQISANMRSGRLAAPATIVSCLQHHQAFRDVGGIRFLADLVDKAPPGNHAPDYARVVVDAHDRREFIRVTNEAQHTLRQDPTVPFTEVRGRLEGALLALETGSRETRTTSAAQAASNVIDALENPALAPPGVSTGLAPLHEITGDWLAKELILLMGRPGAGKSALSSTVCLNVAASHLMAANFEEPDPGQERIGVLQFNGEMTVEQMVRRHMTDLCFRRFGEKAPRYSAIRKRQVTADQLDMLKWARAQLERIPLVMVKRPKITLSQLRSMARRQKAEWARQGIRFGLLVVDHALHVVPDERTRDLRESQTQVSMGLKALADDLDCPVAALNQMNRESEKRYGGDKRPQLADIRESGSWEQDADLVIGVFREAYYAQKEPEPKGGVHTDEWHDWDRRRRSKTIEAIVLKAREGEGGTAELWGSIGHNAILGSAPEFGDLI